MRDVFHHKDTGDLVRENTTPSDKNSSVGQGIPVGKYFLVLGFLLLAVLLLPQCRAALQASPGRWFYILIISCLVSLCMTPLSKVLALTLGAVDWPDRRKNHQQPTPRLGGWRCFWVFLLHFS